MLGEISQSQRDEFHFEEASKAVTLLEAERGMLVARGWEEEEIWGVANQQAESCSYAR